KQPRILYQDAVRVEPDLRRAAVVVQFAGAHDLPEATALAARPGGIREIGLFQHQDRYSRLEQFDRGIAGAGRPQEPRLAVSVGRTALPAALKQMVGISAPVLLRTVEQ